MKYDCFGRTYTTVDELCDVLYAQPNADLSKFIVDSTIIEEVSTYNDAVRTYYEDFPLLEQYVKLDVPLAVFDELQQGNWYMPNEYKNLDIATWVLSQCEREVEKQRVGMELLMYQERDLMNLLRYLKYFVDTMRANNVVWGLGRGSSVASYVLYLIGVHKINSIYYDLPIDEFLK